MQGLFFHITVGYTVQELPKYKRKISRTVSQHDLRHQLVISRTNSYLVVVFWKYRLSDLLDFHTRTRRKIF